MDIIRRNTDYALRAMVYLGGHYTRGPVSARQIAEAQVFSYTLACKLLQRLQQAGLVKSCMGSKGGFGLCRKPAKIYLREIITAIQGPLTLSRCLLGRADCGKYDTCPMRGNLDGLQKTINDYLASTSLDDMMMAEEGGV